MKIIIIAAHDFRKILFCNFGVSSAQYLPLPGSKMLVKILKIEDY